MTGIKTNELQEFVSHCHEIEFEYHGTTYVLQPETVENRSYLTIWDCTPNSAKCIAKQEIATDTDIPHSDIDAVLSQKCFNGKSFYEIEQAITVTTIY